MSAEQKMLHCKEYRFGGIARTTSESCLKRKGAVHTENANINLTALQTRCANCAFSFSLFVVTTKSICYEKKGGTRGET